MCSRLRASQKYSHLVYTGRIMKTIEQPPFAALFDMDGLLVDTEQVQSDAYAVVMQQHYNLTPSTTEHGTIHTPGEKTSATWQRLMQAHGFEGDIDQLSAYKRQAALDILAQGVNAMPGAHELFTMLREHHIPIAISTSAKKDRANLILDMLALKVDALVTADDIEHVKPAPDAYIVAATKLGVQPQKCIVFEDAEVGIISGKDAGCVVVAVPNKFTQRMDFSRADLVVSSLANLTFQKLSRLLPV